MTKTISKRLISVLMAVCMLVILLSGLWYVLPARAASGYMLKVRTETSTWGRVLQEVTLPETGEYIFEAYFKQTVGTAMSLKVMRNDSGIGDKVLSETTDDKTSLHQIRFLADQVNDDDTIKYQIALAVAGSSSANEAYLYLPSVYKADDASKTNLLANTVNSTDLSGWVDRKNWGATAMNATAVAADPTLFGIVEEKPEYMMKVKLVKGGYGRVQQSVKLTETGHYVYQAYFKQTVGSSLKMSVLYNYAGAEIVSDVTDEKTGLRTVEFNARATGSYTFAVSTGWANEGDEAYLYRPVVYKTDDANKTNLLTNSAFENDLSGWTDWSTLETRPDGLVSLGAERVEADPSIFGGEESFEYMLKFAPSEGASWGQYYQNVKLEPGTYIYQAYFKQTKFTSGGANTLQLGVMHNYASVKNVQTTTDAEKNFWTLEFTAEEAGDYWINVGLGWTGDADQMEAYFYQPVLFNKTDAAKKNLLKNADFSDGTANWSERCGDGAGATLGATRVEADPSVFSGEESFEYMLKFAPSEGASWGQYYQNVKLEPGTYIYQAYFKQTKFTSGGANTLQLGVMHNYASVKNVQTTTDAEKNFWTLEFTAEEAGDYWINVGLGWTGDADQMEAYFYQPVLFNKTDAAKKNLLKNADFSDGTANWSERCGDGAGATLGATRVEADPSVFNNVYMLKFAPEVGVKSGGYYQTVHLDAGKYIFEGYFKQTKWTLKTGENTMVLDVLKDGKHLTVTRSEPDALHFFSRCEFTVETAGDYQIGVTLGEHADTSQMEAYLYSPTLYSKDDATKTNKLQNTDLKSGNDGLADWSSVGGFKAVRSNMTDPTIFDREPVRDGQHMLNFKYKKGQGGKDSVLVGFYLPYDPEQEYYIVSFFVKDTLNETSPSFVQTDNADSSSLATIVAAYTEGDKYTYFIHKMPTQTKFSLMLFYADVDLDLYFTGFEVYAADSSYKKISDKNYGAIYGDFTDWYDRGANQVGGIATSTWPYMRLNSVLPVPEGFFNYDPMPELKYDDEWWKKFGDFEDENTETGTVKGTLCDESGAPINGAMLELHSSEDPDRVYSLSTKKDGSFSFENVPVGVYDLCVLAKDETQIFFEDEMIELEGQGDIVMLELTYSGDLSGLDVSPQTGDVLPYGILLSAALSAAALIIISRMHRKKARHMQTSSL